MEKAESAQIPAETQAARIFDLIWDIWQYQGPDIYRFIREKIGPMPKEYLWALFRVVLISFIPSIIFIWLGFSMNSRWLIFLGGLWRAGCTVLLLVALTPVGLLIEVARKGKEGSGQRWAETISGTFIGELFFTLIVMVLLPQMRAHLEWIPVLIMTSMIVGMAAGATFGKGFIAPAAGVIFVATLTFIIFPGPLNKLMGGVFEGNKLEHFEVDLRKLEAGEVEFFDSNGSPKAWAHLEIVDNKVKSVELFTREGYHPILNTKLRPIDRRMAKFIVETKGQYLHPANIKKPDGQPGAQSRATLAPENQKPPAESPAEIPSRINLSKPWKFRYEVIPGYQKYKERAFSGWASARIERWDSEVKIVTLAPDGREIGDFNGTRTGPDAYQGSWSMRDGSGRGKFYCSRENPDRITGSMNDEVVDQRFLPMELCTGRDDRT